jgi:hypothetical protein
MMIRSRVKRSLRAALALALITGATPFVVGCAETSRTEVKRTSVDSGPGASRDREVVERTTVVQKDVPDSCDGILSCTVDFAGDVIAFPFKLVGGIFKALF